MYSGVEQNQTAREGVGCIVGKELNKHIKEWVKIERQNYNMETQLTTTIIVYEPGEDERALTKDQCQ